MNGDRDMPIKDRVIRWIIATRDGMARLKRLAINRPTDKRDARKRRRKAAKTELRKAKP